MIAIRPISPHEWSLYRDTRLRALQDSPDAFGSTWEAEAQTTDARWSERITSAAAGNTDRALFAFNGEDVCGLVWCKLSATEPGVANIYQMWVAPAARGLGVGRSLMSHALAWAKDRGTLYVRLGVTDIDSPAMYLYESLGFFPVGEATPLREGSELMSRTMELRWANR